MISSVSFRGGETTGGVSDRKTETAKQETAGGVGARKSQESIFSVYDEPKQDTVCFRGKEGESKTSTTSVVLGTLGTAAVAIGLLGLAHKYDVVSKIKNPKVQDFFSHTKVVTEPCYKMCQWVKTNCYNKVIDFFKSKK